MIQKTLLVLWVLFAAGLAFAFLLGTPVLIFRADSNLTAGLLFAVWLIGLAAAVAHGLDGGFPGGEL